MKKPETREELIRTRLERMVAGVERDVYAEALHTRRHPEFGVSLVCGTAEAKAVGISARKEPAPLVYDQGEDEFGCDAATERKVRRGK